MKHLLADFLIAFFFLVILSVVLPISLEVVNKISGKTIVDWRSYVELARTDPWGRGLPVTGMLVTTLIPTFLHFCLMVFLLPPSMTFPKWWHWMKERFESGEISGDSHELARWGELWSLVGLVVFTLSVVGGCFYGLSSLLAFFHLPVGGLLYELAIACGDWVT